MQNNIYKIIILFVAVITSNIALGQQANTLFGMKGTPGANEFNPAINRDSSAVFIGLPGISQIGLNFNAGFAYSDLIHFGTGALKDSLIVDLDSFHDALDESNHFIVESDVNIFTLRIRADEYFFNFHIKDRVIAQSSFDKDLVSFLREGNAGYLGKTLDLGSIAYQAMHYREYAIGASRSFMNDRLTVGMRLKMLYGKANLNFNKLNISLATAADGQSLTLNSTGDVNISAPVHITFDEQGFVDDFETDIDEVDYLLTTDNRGVAIDFGADYKINNKWSVGLSVVDLGSIKWNKDVYNLRQNGKFVYEGIDLSQSVNENDPNYIKAEDAIDDLADDIKEAFSIDNTKDSYSTGIPTKVYVSSNYIFNKMLDFSFLGKAYMYEGNNNVSATIAANAMLTKWLSTSLSYSAINNRYDNLGAGLAIRLGAMQWYFVSDNFLAVNRPADCQNVSFRMGMNLLFGRRYLRR